MSDDKKATYQDLVKLKKYPGYYINPLSGKITYRKTVKGKTTKIATGKVGTLKPDGTVIGIKDAKDFVETELAARATGKSKTRIKRERQGVTNPLMMDLFNDCVEERIGREESTRKTYETSRKYAFEPFFKEQTLADFTEADKDSGKPVLKKSFAKDYARWYLAKYPQRQFMPKHFVMFFNFLFREGHISKKPDISALKEVNPIIIKKNQVEPVGRVATESEQDALLAAPAKMMSGEEHRFRSEKRVMAVRTRLLILLGLRYGMRLMESGKLRREKIDLAKGVMFVWSSKNSKWRELPLLQEIVNAFREQFEATGESEWVFPLPSNAKKHCTAQVLYKGWWKAKRIAGIRGRFRYHDLRHTFASRTADENWPPVHACEFLDMSLDVYQNRYAKGSLVKKEQLLRATFESKKGRGKK